MSLIVSVVFAAIILFRKGTHKLGWCLFLFWSAWFAYVDYCYIMDGRWLLSGIFMIFAAMSAVSVIEKHELAVEDKTSEKEEH